MIVDGPLASRLPSPTVVSQWCPSPTPPSGDRPHLSCSLVVAIAVILTVVRFFFWVSVCFVVCIKEKLRLIFFTYPSDESNRDGRKDFALK